MCEVFFSKETVNPLLWYLLPDGSLRLGCGHVLEPPGILGLLLCETNAFSKAANAGNARQRGDLFEAHHKLCFGHQEEDLKSTGHVPRDKVHRSTCVTSFT